MPLTNPIDDQIAALERRFKLAQDMAEKDEALLREALSERHDVDRKLNMLGGLRKVVSPEGERLALPIETIEGVLDAVERDRKEWLKGLIETLAKET